MTSKITEGQLRIAKMIMNEGVCPDEKRIQERIRSNGIMPGFKPMITVTREGEVRGKYWDEIQRFR